MKTTIYLGGTFSNQEIGKLIDRRKDIKNNIFFSCGSDIKILDPLRDKFICNSSKLTDKMEKNYEENFTCNEIVHRDIRDINNSDILLMDLIEPSIGSSMEIMYASFYNKIIIVVTTNPLIRLHPWINSLSTKIFENMDDAIDYIRNYLMD